MPGKKQFYVDKNLITIPPLLNTLIIAVVAPDQMFFLWSSVAHLLASGKSHFAYRKHFLLWFSWGRLVDILSYSPLVCHFILDVVFCCLLRYDLKLKVSDCSFVVLHRTIQQESVCEHPRGGVLPYMGHIVMCRCEGYGFQAVNSSIGYINQSVWV